MPGPYSFGTTYSVGDPAFIAWVDSVGAAFNESASAATANVLILRDSAGRAKVGTPIASTDIVNKTYADGNVAGVAMSGTPGTPSSTTYLRGDGTWSTPAGGSGVSVPFSATPTWRSPYPQQNGTAAPTLGQLILWPVRFDAARTLTGLACYINTAATTGTVQLCVYSDNGSFLPGALLTATSALAATSTGVVSTTFTGVSMPAGYYWIGILVVGTGTPALQVVANVNSSPLDAWNTMPYGTGSTPSVNVGNDGVTATQASLSTAPNPFAGAYQTAHNSGNVRYWMGMQLA